MAFKIQNCCIILTELLNLEHLQWQNKYYAWGGEKKIMQNFGLKLNRKVHFKACLSLYKQLCLLTTM